MVTDIARELRMPPTNIRGYLEAVRDGVVAPRTDVIDSLYEESLLLNRLVEDLQDLALAGPASFASGFSRSPSRTSPRARGPAAAR